MLSSPLESESESETEVDTDGDDEEVAGFGLEPVLVIAARVSLLRSSDDTDALLSDKLPSDESSC